MNILSEPLVNSVILFSFLIFFFQNRDLQFIKKKNLIQFIQNHAALVRDRAPMVQRTLLNLLRLLLLLGTEHRWCEDPIESAPFIRDRAPMVRGPY